jgi:hypothetical protein
MNDEQYKNSVVRKELSSAYINHVCSFTWMRTGNKLQARTNENRHIINFHLKFTQVVMRSELRRADETTTECYNQLNMHAW